MAQPLERSKSIGELLSPKEVRNRTREVLLQYAVRSSQVLFPMVKRGEGKASLGSVPGRPDDEQIAIDALGENILVNLLRDARLPAFVLGEHTHHDFSDGAPQVVSAIDALDNSSEYSRGLDTPPYTVVGSYSPDGSPIGAMVGDIRGQKAYISLQNENFILDLSTNNLEHRRIDPSPKRTSIMDDKITIASYLGSNEYSTKFFGNFGSMVKSMPRKARVYANGGSFIYAHLATGAVDAYVMFDEPHSEIIPGLPLALAADCTIVSVNPDGTYEDYTFNPEFVKNPELYTHGTVDLFIAARTTELRDEIIKHYMSRNEPRAKKRKPKD